MVYEKTIMKGCVSSGHLVYHTKNSDFQKEIGTKLDDNDCFQSYRCEKIIFWLIFCGKFEQNTKISFSSETVKYKEHKETISSEKYDF